jgi:2-amino-4-hydroxy-6-hydroxymethyldihydropteridine diphosphokinase
MIRKRNAILRSPEWVIIGIGANLGAPRVMIETALKELSEIAMNEVVCSSIWKSEASGMDGDDFANAVAKFEFNESPHNLLGKLQSIEAKYGRAPDHGHHTPRTLDLDIIAFGDQQISEVNLCIPHPHAAQRLFVLLPLREVDPNFRFFDQPKSLDELIERAERLRIEKWED